ncbi:MAG: ABC transporter permease [Actinobacteria bacterium]|nr:ABC transporter permease [Actinomycetota bacterium]
MNRYEKFKRFSRDNIPFYTLILLVIFLSSISPYFYKPGNIMIILQNAAINGAVAIGATLVIIAGEFDLSIGTTMTLTAAFAVGFQRYFSSIFLVCFIAIISGMMVGLFNGLLVTKARLNSFIATLGTFIMLDGIILLYTHSESLRAINENYALISEGKLLNIRYPIWVIAFLLILTHFFLTKSRIGRYIFAIGGNKSISNLFGINTDKIKIFTFMFCGAFAAISGILLSSRVMSASPLFGERTMLIVYGAIFLGGTSLRGGEGGVIKTMIAILVLSLLQNAFGILGIPLPYQLYVWGGILILMVTLDRKKHQKAI